MVQVYGVNWLIRVLIWRQVSSRGLGPSSLSDLENEGPLASIIRPKKFTRGQIFIYKRLQTPKSDRLLGGS